MLFLVSYILTDNETNILMFQISNVKGGRIRQGRRVKTAGTAATTPIIFLRRNDRSFSKVGLRMKTIFLKVTLTPKPSKMINLGIAINYHFANYNSQ